MDQLHLMQVFESVAQSKGFAAAARKLNMSPPAVTRAVAALENQLGVKLLYRTTRFVRTTDAGERYLTDISRILKDIEQANTAVLGVNSAPTGKLNITAPVLFGQQYVLPVVSDYLSTYPNTEVNVALLDRTVNLLEEGFDVGLRIGDLPDSTMKARKIGEVSLLLVASEQYLQRRGIPMTPAELKSHDVITSTSNDFSLDWQFVENKKRTHIRMTPRLSVNTNQGAIEAAKSHFGIARVVSYQVAEEISQGRLTPLLPDNQLPPLPINLIHRETTQTQSKVRTFIDMMASRYQDHRFS